LKKNHLCQSKQTFTSKTKANMTAFPSVSNVWLLFFLPTAIAWIHPVCFGVETKAPFRKDRILLFSDRNFENDYTELPNVLETDDPCWQNMLDDDCSMGNIYAANFVAGKWIKSMPCGQGIEVRSKIQDGPETCVVYVPSPTHICMFVSFVLFRFCLGTLLIVRRLGL
jgi:hypothetical protein